MIRAPSSDEVPHGCGLLFRFRPVLGDLMIDGKERFMRLNLTRTILALAVSVATSPEHGVPRMGDK